MTPQKPRTREGYGRQETDLVEMACLTVAVTLGPLMKDVRIVGGLVPSLIIDRALTAPDPAGVHVGTNDLDVGLSVALLEEERYAEIGDRLSQEGFAPDHNAQGNPTKQRWVHSAGKVTIDFLLPPVQGGPAPGRVQHLDERLGALIMPGIELAVDEPLPVTMRGNTLTEELAEREISVCGPGAFTVLKALALDGRGEPKDAYDLTYVLAHWPAGAKEIAERLQRHAERHSSVVTRALGVLARDFEGEQSVGPRRAADFFGYTAEQHEQAVADALGHVDALLGACEVLGLRPDR